MKWLLLWYNEDAAAGTRIVVAVEPVQQTRLVKPGAATLLTRCDVFVFIEIHQANGATHVVIHVLDMDMSLEEFSEGSFSSRNWLIVVFSRLSAGNEIPRYDKSIPGQSR